MNCTDDLDAPPIPKIEDEEDISEYKFSKFAAMYFQASNLPTYIRRTLKESLLPLKSDGDKLVSFILLPFENKHNTSWKEDLNLF
jgi:myosin-7